MKEHRLVGTFALLILGLCVAGIASAQSATRVTPCSATTPNNAICLTWTHDGKTVDGVAISGVTFRVAQKAGTGSFSNIANALTTPQLYVQNLAVGSYTFQVFASCPTCTAEGAGSNAATGSATQVPVVPSAPVLIIAATIKANGPPTFRVVYTVTPKPGEIVFVAPASLKPYIASR